MNDDTISRAEALKALEWKWAGKAAIDVIRELPSAEPQIVRCEKCIYWDEKTYPSTLSGVLHPCRWWPINTTPLDYCGHGKGRADDER